MGGLGGSLGDLDGHRWALGSPGGALGGFSGAIGVPFGLPWGALGGPLEDTWGALGGGRGGKGVTLETNCCGLFFINSLGGS